MQLTRQVEDRDHNKASTKEGSDESVSSMVKESPVNTMTLLLIPELILSDLLYLTSLPLKTLLICKSNRKAHTTAYHNLLLQ